MVTIPSNFPHDSVQTTNASGAFYIDVKKLECDSTTADFAFKISIVSGNPTGRIANIESKQNTDDFNVLISPNPSDGIFNIIFTGQNNSNITNELFLYNSLGNLILNETNVTNKSIDLSNQPKGVYYLKVSSNNTNKYFKLIRS